MAEGVWLALAAVFAISGMGWLALSMDVHWRQALRSKPGHNSGLYRILGGAGLVLSLCFSLLADHPSMAALVWFMLMAAAAFFIAMLLSWRPQWLRWLAIIPGT